MSKKLKDTFHKFYNIFKVIKDLYNEKYYMQSHFWTKTNLLNELNFIWK